MGKIIIIGLLILTISLIGCEEVRISVDNCIPNTSNRYYGNVCCEDCEELGKEFYKFHGGGFGGSSCWCKDGNETKRVW